jgi:hypothetical protein
MSSQELEEIFVQYVETKTFSMVDRNCWWLEDDALDNKSPRPCLTNFWRQVRHAFQIRQENFILQEPRELGTNAVHVCVQKTTLICSQCVDLGDVSSRAATSTELCYWNAASDWHDCLLPLIRLVFWGGFISPVWGKNGSVRRMLTGARPSSPPQ